MSPCFGLTGGIGSGKSTVAELFANLGVRIVDTDRISRELTAPQGAAIPAIRQTFGGGYLTEDGALDRNKMRALAFSDEEAKQRLQSILHPMILAQARAEALSPCDAPYTLVVVPLLFESGRYHDWLKRVIVVDCTEDQQVARTIQRSQLDVSSVRAIMAQQLGRTARNERADEIIHNDSDLASLEAQVSKLHKRLCEQ